MPTKSRRFFVKHSNITTVILAVVVTMACDKSSETPARQGAGTNSDTIRSVTASPDYSRALPVTVAHPNAAAPQTLSGSGTAQGMNPPHGQPNHRCDIPVGSPLNSPPGTQPTAPTPSQANVPPQTGAPSTAPGMNPPHGQPSHRCDIPVGSPLNSPPAKAK